MGLMFAKLKIPEWMKRAIRFFSKINGTYDICETQTVSGLSAAMVADRKLEYRPVIDKKAALYQAVRGSEITPKDHM